MIILLILTYVQSHGFLVHPGPLNDALLSHGVRNYNSINNNIDSLREPSTVFCRNAERGPTTKIQLVNGQEFSVTQAFSIGAYHIGECTVEIFDQKNHSNIIEIAGDDTQCARTPVAQFNHITITTATNLCPNNIPTNLITNDMCLNEWTFIVKNADKITCTDCVLRWTWVGRHISPPDFYENCADVQITSSIKVVSKHNA